MSHFDHQICEHFPRMKSPGATEIGKVLISQNSLDFFLFQLTVFLQLEQNSKAHVGHKTDLGSGRVAFAVDEVGC